MKKWKTAACIAGGVILAAGAGIFAFVPGLFTYLHVKFRYDNIDRTVPQYERASVPENFTEYTVKGLTLSVPSSYTLNDTGFSFVGSDGKSRLFITRHDMLATAAILSEYGTDDLYETKQFSDAEYRHYFEKVGVPAPSDADARTEELWYAKGTLQPEDCLRLRGTDRKIFADYALTKEESWNMEQTWSLPMNGAAAYVSESTAALTSSIANNTVCIYPDEHRSEKIMVVLREQDPKTAKQIISSMRLEPEQQSTGEGL
ncbi:MAG: hypothetical protein IKQ39_04185 [Oscillospiraceae bacterium]|nr:hypothetical protein [Oscillospiraceae bacterium]